jgi:hypothetical protein
MKNLYILFFLLISLNLFAQPEEKIPESVLCSPVLLSTNLGFSSGIFLADTLDNVYFITARHALFEQVFINNHNKIDTTYNLSSKIGRFTFYPHNIYSDIID